MEEEIKKEEKKEEKLGFNITSIILGIISLVLVYMPHLSLPCAIISIIFGILGINKSGRGMGIAGLVCSIISIAILLVWLVYAVVVCAAI